MNKKESLELARKKYGIDFETTNTHFSKENEQVQFINLIVNDSGEMVLLKDPTKYFKENMADFKVREKEQRICLELDTKTFQNKVGASKLSFKQFVK